MALDLAGQQWDRWDGSDAALQTDQSGQPSEVVLDASTAVSVPYIATLIERSGSATHLRIGLSVKASDLKLGAQPWQRPQFLVLSYDGDLKALDYWPRKVLSIDRDADWATKNITFPIHPETRVFRLLLFNAARSGVLAVQSLDVTDLKEKRAFLAFRYVIVALWVLLSLHIARTLLRQGGRTSGKVLVIGLATVATMATVTPQPYYGRVVTVLEGLAFGAYSYSSFIPAEKPAVVSRTSPTPEVAQGAAERPKETSEPSPKPERQERQPTASEQSVEETDEPQSSPLDELTFKEISHFTAFLLISLVSLMSFKDAKPHRVLGFVLLFAASTELLQLLVSTRSASLSDLLIDGFGVLAGGILFVIGTVVANRRQNLQGAPAG